MAALRPLREGLDPSWVQQLEPDPETEKNAPNRRSRQVKSGHYVLVDPTPLPSPQLVAHSAELAAELGFEEAEVASEAFARFFSGDVAQLRGEAAQEAVPAWATPYALSIMGERYTHNCPFKNGNGYGDGRAISIAEVVLPSGQRWELQLKGAGRTPFCRGADGRAVLRSSIREFLASEAMHHLGVPTTRALSLVVSGEETVQRAWYGDAPSADVNEDDPRLARFPKEMRAQLVEQLRQQSRDPDILIREPCAITCRAAPSFARVGHLDLFSRRAGGKNPDAERLLQLEQLLEHVLFREYPELSATQNDAPLPDRALLFLRAFGDRLSGMVAGWLRVGFAQGNFNADNCLVGGRTMDYGPFGWIEEYDPLFAKWTGSGQHFGFMMQPNAAFANLHTLTQSLEPLFPEERRGELRAAYEACQPVFVDAVNDVWRRKLGFPEDGQGALAAGDVLFRKLEPVLRKSRTDYTIFWRQLAAAVEALMAGADDDAVLEALAPAFYAPLTPELKEKWAAWFDAYEDSIRASGDVGPADDAALGAAFAARMRAENPKYVLREWMLVDAYNAADGGGDLGPFQELQALTKRPYDEHPDMEAKYYVRAPDGVADKGGVGFMT